MTIKEGVTASAPQLSLYLTSFREGSFIFFVLSLHLLLIFGKDQRPNLMKC